MADTTISPNMMMPIPNVSIAPGPDWATDINASLNIIDSHNHSPGQGVQINPDGIDINDDLPFNGENAITLRSARFTAQGSPLAGSDDLGCLYVSGVDLYYNDENGNQIRITASGSVTGAAGTITGLPSGTASASYSAGTFTFQSATNTPATMAVGPLVIGAQVASAKTVTLAPSSSQPSNYSLTFPLAAPAAYQVLQSDGSGNLAWTRGLLPLGSVVATFPNLTGAYSTSATTAADSYGFVKCNGQTISDASSPMDGQVVPNINNDVFLKGSTTAGSTGGSATASGVGAHTHTFSSSSQFATDNHTHLMPHTHKWGLEVPSGDLLYTLSSSSVASTTITNSDYALFSTAAVTSGGGTQAAARAHNTTTSLYTTGGTDGVSGSSGATIHTDSPNAYNPVTGTTGSTGTSFSIVPPFISAVYLMRIK